MRVKSCSAESENSRAIQLSDEHGCVLRPKMISKFMKIAGADTRASVITYAFFHAFKFPDSMSVHVMCKVNTFIISFMVIKYDILWIRTNIQIIPVINH